MKKKDILLYSVTILFLLFTLVSYFAKFDPGVKLLSNFWEYIKFVLFVMPAVFLIIGLFNVWVKKETVIKHMGNKSGLKGYALAILLAFASIGGLFTAFPISKQLHDKGSKLSVVLVYLGASCICRIPMTLWEASMLGIEFTIIRFMVSLPLVVISSIFIEKVFGKNIEIEIEKAGRQLEE